MSEGLKESGILFIFCVRPGGSRGDAVALGRP